MTLDRFANQIEETPRLRALIGEPSELVIKKELAELDRHMQSFIAQAPFALLATVDREGRCDVSPRGDSPAVATVLDSKHLCIAERPGNRRADSLRNILQTGRVGLLFLIPGVGETLRVNGKACLFEDPQLLSQMSSHGKQPALGIGVEVEECYLQCAKALIRSRLWEDPAQRTTPQVAVPHTERAAARSSFVRSRWSLESIEGSPESSTPQMPSFAEILIEQTGIEDETVESLAARIEEAYQKRLY